MFIIYRALFIFFLLIEFLIIKPFQPMHEYLFLNFIHSLNLLSFYLFHLIRCSLLIIQIIFVIGCFRFLLIDFKVIIGFNIIHLMNLLVVIVNCYFLIIILIDLIFLISFHHVLFNMILFIHFILLIIICLFLLNLFNQI